MRSLPSHIEHTELTRMLTEHLADYPEIKSVKVVRDNKGGVCAFVQCEVSQLYSPTRVNCTLTRKCNH